MYEIYVRFDTSDPQETVDSVLWSPALIERGYILYSAQLDLRLNHSGKLTFQMSPKHPFYGMLRKRKTRIVVKRKDVEIWRGRVLDSKSDFYKRQTVVCEGMLSWLMDSVQRPYSFYGPINEYITRCLSLHNEECDSDKQFVLGQITAVSETTIVNVVNLTPSEYPKTLDELNDTLVDQYGGYFKARYDETTDTNYLDYLSSSGEVGNQKIEFGKNLLNFEDYITAENVYTRCVPLGATLRAVADYWTDASPDYISNLKEEDANKRLTISELFSDKRDFIENETAINLFGRNTTSVVFDSALWPVELLKQGRRWLEDNISMNVSMKIKAIDLSLLTDDIDAIDCGSSAEVVSAPHEVDTFMLCSELLLDILQPSQTDYTFGSGFNAMTDQQAKSIRQSSKAFTMASSASTSAKSISSTVTGSYLTASEFNSFKDEIEEILADIDDLPEATTLDEGKVLKVVGGKWVKADDEIGDRELPEVTTLDDGKVLKVVDGKWVIADDEAGSIELPEVTEADNGKVLKVVDGVWMLSDDSVGQIELPEVTEEDEGKILKVVGGKWTAVLQE